MKRGENIFEASSQGSTLWLQDFSLTTFHLQLLQVAVGKALGLKASGYWRAGGLGRSARAGRIGPWDGQGGAEGAELSK